MGTVIGMKGGGVGAARWVKGKERFGGSIVVLKKSKEVNMEAPREESVAKMGRRKCDREWKRAGDMRGRER